MAFIAQNLEQDETLIPQGGGGLIGGGGNEVVAPQEGAPPAGAQTGSGFVDLRKYLDANTAQAGKTAGKLKDELLGEAQALEQEIGDTSTGFAEEVEAKNPLNQAIVDEAKTDAQAVADDPTKRSEFIRMRSGTYTGPETIQDYDPYYPLKANVEQGLRRADLKDTSEGRYELLQSLERPSTTRGESHLDQFLLSSPDSVGILGEGSEALRNQGTALDTLGKDALGVVGDRQKMLSDYARQIMNEFTGEGGVVSGFQGDLSDRYAAALNDAGTRLAEAYRYNYPQEYRDQFTSTPSDSLVPSVMGGIETRPYEPPPAPIVPEFDPGLSSFASANDFAYEAALEDLLGMNLDALNNSEAGQAGTFNQLLNDLIAAVPENATPINVPQVTLPTTVNPEDLQDPETPTFDFNYDELFS